MRKFKIVSILFIIAAAVAVSSGAGKPTRAQMEQKLRSIWKSQWPDTKIVSIAMGKPHDYVEYMGALRIPTPTYKQQFDITGDAFDGSQGIYRDYLYYQQVQGSWVYWKYTTEGRVKELRGATKVVAEPKFEEVKQSIIDYIYKKAEEERKKENHFLTRSKSTYPHDVNLDAKYRKKYKPDGYVTGYLYPNILDIQFVKLAHYAHEDGYYRADIVVSVILEEQYKDAPNKKAKESIKMKCNLRIMMKATKENPKWEPYSDVDCEPPCYREKCQCLENCQ